MTETVEMMLEWPNADRIHIDLVLAERLPSTVSIGTATGQCTVGICVNHSGEITEQDVMEALASGGIMFTAVIRYPAHQRLHRR